MGEVEESFLDYFQDLKDPRSTRNRLYTIAEILLLTLCAVICGAEGWKDIEYFGKKKLNYLRRYLPYKNGTPSDDTIRRFFRAIDPDQFQELFRNWVKSLRGTKEEKVIAIDGKSSRGSRDGDGNMLHMISAYATEARMVLCQEKVSKKSNEITAIPKLLEWLDIRGSVVTIDAMGCQYSIANKILEKGGNYIFSLKGNQRSLFKDVQSHFRDKELKESLKVCKTVSKAHGRNECRKCWVDNNVDGLKARHPNWSSIKSIACIERSREINGKVTTEIRYHISSLDEDPKKFLSTVRSHWAIENSLHWVLDMSFGEDQSKIRKENAPHNAGIVRHIAFNLLQLAKANSQSTEIRRQSIKGLRKLAVLDWDILDDILSQHFP